MREEYGEKLKVRRAETLCELKSLALVSYALKRSCSSVVPTELAP